MSDKTEYALFLTAMYFAIGAVVVGLTYLTG